MVAHVRKKMVIIKIITKTATTATMEKGMTTMMNLRVRLLRVNKQNPKIQMETITAMETICVGGKMATAEAILKFKNSARGSN